MTEDEMLRLSQGWNVLRAATVPTIEVLQFGTTPADLALSFMAGRRELWTAFVGMIGYSRQLGMEQPTHLFRQLQSAPSAELIAGLETYGESLFDDQPSFLPSAQEIISFVPPETLGRAATLAMSWGFCYQVCSGDPECVAKCLKSRRDNIDERPSE